MTPRSKAAFEGLRLTVLDWQMKDLERMLGRYASEFDVFAFVSDLDESLNESGEIVPPQSEQHRWLQELVYLEVKRRGLPTAKALKAARPTWSLALCPHRPKCGTAWRCHQLKEIAAHKGES